MDMDMGSMDASRVAAAMQLAQATEKNEKKMTDKHKGVIQDIMKTDVIADALLKEEMMAQSIAKTKVDIHSPRGGGRTVSAVWVQQQQQQQRLLGECRTHRGYSRTGWKTTRTRAFG